MAEGREAADDALLVMGWRRSRDAVGTDLRAHWARLQAQGAACPSADLRAELAELGDLRDVRWWDETAGLPEEDAFILDLEDRASVWGGLLLIPDGERLSGWRPEAGALTVFRAGRMVLSPLVPGAPQRRAIIGRLA